MPTDATVGSFSEELAEDLIERTALGAPGSPGDIGAMACFLATPAAAWITGQVIAVDGGMGVQPMADLSEISRRLYGDAPVRDALERTWPRGDARDPRLVAARLEPVELPGVSSPSSPSSRRGVGFVGRPAVGKRSCCRHK